MKETPKKLVGLPLRQFGYIHVTGLPARRSEMQYTIRPSANDLGKWNWNNGMVVAVTESGEVWLRTMSEMGVSEKEAILDLCPRGVGATVPCSNGEAVPSHMLMSRNVNPEWDGRGKYPWDIPQGEETLTGFLELARMFEARAAAV